MQFFNDSTLYFFVLPRDFVMVHLKRFCFDYRKLQRYLSIRLHDVGKLAFDYDGNVIAVRFYANTISVHSGSSQREFRYDAPWQCIADETGRFYSPNGKHVDVLRSDGSRETTIEVGEKTHGIAVRGEELYVSTKTGLRVFNTTQIREFCRPCTVFQVAVSAHIIVTTGLHSAVIVYQHDGTIMHSFHQQWTQFAIDVDDHIFAVRDRSWCEIYSCAGELLGRLPHKFKKAIGVAVSPTTVAVSDKNGIHLFSIKWI